MHTLTNTYTLKMGGSVVHTQGQWGERFNPWLVACSTASRCCPRRGKSCQADRKLQQGPGTALTPHRPQCASQGEPVHMCTHTHTHTRCINAWYPWLHASWYTNKQRKARTVSHTINLHEHLWYWETLSLSTQETRTILRKILTHHFLFLSLTS